jgi:ribosomal protein L44E
MSKDQHLYCHQCKRMTNHASVSSAEAFRSSGIGRLAGRAMDATGFAKLVSGGTYQCVTCAHVRTRVQECIGKERG